MTRIPSPPESAGAHDWRAHLAITAVAFPEFGCYVAVTEDRRTIFWCPMRPDGTPEPDADDPRHLDWGEVTVPDSEFLAAVNDHFGTSFTLDGFAGR